MTLTERLTCRVVGCGRHRAPDTDVCADDLREKWLNRLVRQADGSYLRRRTFAPRDMTGQLAA